MKAFNEMSLDSCNRHIESLERDIARLRAFVRQLRDDGLDIDDTDTAPTWTGKIHRRGVGFSQQSAR